VESKNGKRYKRGVKAVIQPIVYEVKRQGDRIELKEYPIGRPTEVYEYASIGGVWPRIVKSKLDELEYESAAYMVGVDLDEKGTIPFYEIYTESKNDWISIRIGRETVEVLYVKDISPTTVIKSGAGETKEEIIPSIEGCQDFNLHTKTEEVLKPGEYIEFIIPSFRRLIGVEVNEEGSIPVVDLASIVSIRVYAKKLEEELYQ